MILKQDQEIKYLSGYLDFYTKNDPPTGDSSRKKQSASG